MEWGTYIAVRIVWALLGALPLRLVIGVGRCAGILGWLFAGSYRRLVLRNLNIAFGDELTLNEKRRIGREHFARMAGNFAAGACLSTVPAARLLERVTVEGLENLDAPLAAGKGVIMLLGHLGNWELLARVTPQLFPAACGSVYQALRNSLVDAWVRRQRATEGLQLFARKEGFHGAIELLRSGGIVGVLGDQHAGDGGVWCSLFGRLASSSPLVATMALRTGAAVMGVAMYTEPGGRWRLVLRPAISLLSRDSAALTAETNRELERMIRRAPADWLWAHNRWKTPFPRFLAIGGKRGVVAEGIQKPFRLLLRSVNWLGDAVMTVPSIRAIRRSRPDLEITVVCQSKLAGFWEAVPEVDRVVPLPAGAGILHAARILRQCQYDAILLFPNSLRTGLEAWFAGIPRRVGFPGHSRSWLLNQVFEKLRPSGGGKVDPRHQVHDYLELAASMGAPALDSSDWMAEREPLPGGGSLRPWKIAVCPGAEFGGAKRWLPERFAEVIRLFSQKNRVEWHLVGVAKDAPVGDAILRDAGRVPVENWIGRTSLGELIELLRSCDALLSNDTGTMHLAAMLGVPVVAIFGSTEPRLTGPLGQGHQILQHRVPCGPCFQRECHLEFACMKGVPAPDAVHALEAVLHSKSQQTVPSEKGSPLGAN